MTTLVTRAQWGARARKVGTTGIDPTEGVTIHYEGGGWPFPWDHSTCDDKVRNMQADHMDNRGWSDIAYNYLGCPHNYLYEGRGYDRRSSANGYESANATSFAVQGIWGDASGKPPDDLKRAIHYGIEILRSKGGASDKLHGHRDWKSTSCPGDYLYAWVKQGCPLPGTITPPKETDMLDTTDLHKIEAIVQRYSQFNADNLRQRIDDIANAVTAALDPEMKADHSTVMTELAKLEAELGLKA
jgi:hypothetical protein